MTAATSDVNQRRILPIQYLRGIAALLVVWHHARSQLPGMEALIPGDFGTSGVDLFFVISGFIMVVTTTGISVRPWEFFSRRLVRVVPLYWLLTLSMVAADLTMPGLFRTLVITPAALLQSLLFIPHFSHSFPAQVWPLLVPGWTLNFEMFFYSVFGISLFLPARGRLAALTACLLVLTAVGSVLGPFSDAAARIYTSPLLLEFVAGALIGSWWVRGKSNLPLMLSLSLIFVGATLLVLRDSEPLLHFMQIIGATLVVIGALDSRFKDWRSNGLRALGDSSYSLYLTHIFTLGGSRAIWTKLISNVSPIVTAWGFMVVSIILSVLVGWVTFRWVESPLLRLMSKRKSLTDKPSIANRK